MNKHISPEFRFSRREPVTYVRAEELRTPVRTVTSESLFLGAHEIGIAHAGSLYRLKITRQGKLILNK
ncbi:MAG: hemin uptake protein HemP [Rhizobiaceae bacterium]